VKSFTFPGVRRRHTAPRPRATPKPARVLRNVPLLRLQPIRSWTHGNALPPRCERPVPRRQIQIQTPHSRDRLPRVDAGQQSTSPLPELDLDSCRPATSMWTMSGQRPPCDEDPLHLSTPSDASRAASAQHCRSRLAHCEFLPPAVPGAEIDRRDPEEGGYPKRPAIAPKTPMASRKTTMPMTTTAINRKIRNQKQPL
jgi:hypothetical protein